MFVCMYSPMRSSGSVRSSAKRVVRLRAKCTYLLSSAARVFRVSPPTIHRCVCVCCGVCRVLEIRLSSHARYCVHTSYIHSSGEQHRHGRKRGTQRDPGLPLDGNNDHPKPAGLRDPHRKVQRCSCLRHLDQHGVGENRTAVRSFFPHGCCRCGFQCSAKSPVERAVERVAFQAGQT